MGIWYDNAFAQAGSGLSDTVVTIDLEDSREYMGIWYDNAFA